MEEVVADVGCADRNEDARARLQPTHLGQALGQRLSSTGPLLTLDPDGSPTLRSSMPPELPEPALENRVPVETPGVLEGACWRIAIDGVRQKRQIELASAAGHRAAKNDPGTLQFARVRRDRRQHDGQTRGHIGLELSGSANRVNLSAVPGTERQPPFRPPGSAPHLHAFRRTPEFDRCLPLRGRRQFMKFARLGAAPDDRERGVRMVRTQMGIASMRFATPCSSTRCPRKTILPVLQESAVAVGVGPVHEPIGTMIAVAASTPSQGSSSAPGAPATIVRFVRRLSRRRSGRHPRRRQSAGRGQTARARSRRPSNRPRLPGRTVGPRGLEALQGC